MDKATIVVDLGYGDAGKGSMVDYLARRSLTSDSTLVVRFNGGPQAAHNVVLPDGRHHTFASFGAGTFAGARTHLSQDVLVNPMHVYAEAEALCQKGVSRPMDGITFDFNSKVITPWHKALNRIRERSRGAGRHGSCGQGIGEVMSQSFEAPHLTVRMRHGLDRPVLDELIEYLRLNAKTVVAEGEDHPDNEADFVLFESALVREAFVAALKDCAEGRLVLDEHALDSATHVIFEGAQGVLLDENYGWHPYTTWSTTTQRNATQMVARYRNLHGRPVHVTTLGLTRSYMTRHGAGPFVTEASLFQMPVEKHNGFNDWQRGWRTGHLDLVALEYALSVCRYSGTVDGLVVSHLDEFIPVRWCVDYENMPKLAWDRLKHPALPPQTLTSELSDALFTARPIYEAISKEPAAYAFLPNLSLALHTAVLYTSYGPTYRDKKEQW